MLGTFALGFVIAWLLFKDSSSSSDDEGEDTAYGGASEDMDALIAERDDAIRTVNSYASQLEHCQDDLNSKVVEMTAENNDLKLALESCRKGLLEEGVTVTERPKIEDLPSVHTAANLDANQLVTLDDLKVERDELETKLVAANGSLSVIGNSFGVVFDPNSPADLLAKVKELGAQHKELTAKIAKLEKDNSGLEGDLEECKSNLTNIIGASEFTEMPIGFADGTVLPKSKKKPAKKAKAKPKAKTTAKAKTRAAKPSKQEILSNISAEKGRVDFGIIGTSTIADKDDLKKIKGIGPFIEKKLHALGIFTFEQVSKFTAEISDEVTDIIKSFAGRIQRDNWIGQAKDFHENK